MNRGGWELPDGTTPLGEGEVHLWWGVLGDVAAVHFRLLDDVERERYSRLHRADDRSRFLLGCVLLRLAVAGQVGLDPRDVAITRMCLECGKPHGKPQASAYPELEASLSHSGDRAAVALTVGAALGVDVEAVQEPNRIDEMAPFVLSPNELAAFSRLPPGEQPNALLSYWTRKEALLKASGHGLRVPLVDVEVSGPDETPSVRSWRGMPGMAERTRLYQLRPGPGYVASLAVIGEGDWHVRELHGLALLRSLEER